ncbi:MAG: metallophosphoesterase family protein [Bacteroidales bacterium]|nr:metallophosphoesterase family protein [Bacteroidales bacterium]MCR5243646.1 metallophosphatase family protein [Bacteroidales bacterium]MDT3356789.1 metallophosphatase family protein [Bacteroidota bacterium]
MYVGIISDTHGVFSEEFRNFLAPVDVIWHAGDFGGGIDFVHTISAFKPLVGVYGNCDAQEIRFECPLVQLFNCEGLKVMMTHIGGYPGHYPLNVRAMIDRHRPDIFVCGHSHILKVMRDPQYNLLAINPGAAGIQGWHAVRTALRMRVDNGKPYDLEVFELPRR